MNLAAANLAQTIIATRWAWPSCLWMKLESYLSRHAPAQTNLTLPRPSLFFRSVSRTSHLLPGVILPIFMRDKLQHNCRRQLIVGLSSSLCGFENVDWIPRTRRFWGRVWCHRCDKDIVLLSNLHIAVAAFDTYFSSEEQHLRSLHHQDPKGIQMIHLPRNTYCILSPNRHKSPRNNAQFSIGIKGFISCNLQFTELRSRWSPVIQRRVILIRPWRSKKPPLSTHPDLMSITKTHTPVALPIAIIIASKILLPRRTICLQL